MSRLIWSVEAVDDLEAIVAFIGRDSAVRASFVARRIIGCAERLAEFPELGAVILESPDHRYRHLLYSPFRIIYRVSDETVYLVAVIHGARDWSPPQTN